MQCIYTIVGLLHYHSYNHIDCLDTDKRSDDATDPVEKKIMDQELLGRHGTEFGPLQRQRHQHRNDNRIENDRRHDCTEGTRQVHDVEYPQLRIDREHHRRDDGKLRGDIVGDAEGGQIATSHQDLFPHLDDVEEFGRVAVQIDDIGRLFRSLSTGVHRHRYVRLG